MSLVLGTLAIVSLFISFMAYACVLAKTKQRFGTAEIEEPISVLKPLKGVDEGLYENLVALARQDYPHFEILFGAEDADDPALDVARRVQAEFPDVKMRIVLGAAADGLNPKVRLLRRLLPLATHEWILVSDSNVRPARSYLREIRACQQATRADLVHNLLVGVGERSLGAKLENLHMNGWVSASIAFCDAGEHPCVIGKSMLMKKSSLAQVGGFEDVRDILAEDYILGSRFGAAGMKVVLSPHLLPVVSGARDFGVFWNRHVRWGQLRRHIAPVFFLGEIFVNPLPFLIGWACVGGPEFRAFALAALGVKWLVDIAMWRRLGAGTSWATFLWLPLKDLMVPLMWVTSGVRTRVSWRGNHMRIGAQSRLFPIEEQLEVEPQRA